MLGRKEKHFKVHTQLTLDALVPPDNFYRQVEAKLDLMFVRELVKNCYASRMGRPSIDPMVFFKLQLIMFFEGIRSERQLMDMVPMRLDHRWYIGYDLDEAVPDHSSLSKIRDRYGLEIFQQFFEHIVELCVEAGLVWGRELYFDGTKVEANADINRMVPRFYYEAKQHLQAVFAQQANDGDVVPQPEQPAIRDTSHLLHRLVQKYDGTRLTSRPNHWYQRTTDRLLNPTDPDASPMSRFTGAAAKLGYHTHYVVDGGKARIILAALVTPASIMDNTPMLDLARWARFRWRLFPLLAVGDAKYGTKANIIGLEQDGLRAYMPLHDQGRQKKVAHYPLSRFLYDPQRDLYLCPQGQQLPYVRRKRTEDALVYQAQAQVCNACPVKAQCTKSNKGRQIHRSFFQVYLDRVQAYQETDAYKKAMRKRLLWVEPLFGEGKQWHRLRRFLLRGLEKVNIQGMMIAAGQNIKRLLKAKRPPRRPNPAGVVALAAPFSLF